MVAAAELTGQVQQIAAAPEAKWGDPRLPQRFWDKVSPCPITGCWHWTGGTNVGVANGKCATVRRAFWDALVGGSQGGSRLHSSCDLSCCNPEHMREAPFIPADRRREHHSAKSKEYRAKNSARLKRSYWAKWLRVQYGLTEERYAEMLRTQCGRCMICNHEFGSRTRRDGRPRKNRDVNVDHCHKTDTVRDLLCFGCNVGLGMFGSDPALLRTAADYLERHACAHKASQ